MVMSSFRCLRLSKELMCHHIGHGLGFKFNFHHNVSNQKKKVSHVHYLGHHHGSWKIRELNKKGNISIWRNYVVVTSVKILYFKSTHDVMRKNQFFWVIKRNKAFQEFISSFQVFNSSSPALKNLPQPSEVQITSPNYSIHQCVVLLATCCAFVLET